MSASALASISEQDRLNAQLPPEPVGQVHEVIPRVARGRGRGRGRRGRGHGREAEAQAEQVAEEVAEQVAETVVDSPPHTSDPSTSTPGFAVPSTSTSGLRGFADFAATPSWFTLPPSHVLLSDSTPWPAPPTLYSPSVTPEEQSVASPSTQLRTYTRRIPRRGSRNRTAPDVFTPSDPR